MSQRNFEKGTKGSKALRRYTTEDNPYPNLLPPQLPDSFLEKVQQALTIVSIGVIVVRSDGKILLVKRKQESFPHWWIVGGYKMASEDHEATARHYLSLGLGIDMSQTANFIRVREYHLVWNTNERKRDECDTLNIVLATTINDSQAYGLRLNEHYAERQWIEPLDILRAEEQYHPALWQIIEDYVNLPRT